MTIKDLIPLLRLSSHITGKQGYILVSVGPNSYELKSARDTEIDPLLYAALGDYIIETIIADDKLGYAISVKTAPVRKGVA